MVKWNDGVLNLPLSGFELATQWSEAQHATAGLRRPPVIQGEVDHVDQY